MLIALHRSMTGHNTKTIRNIALLTVGALTSAGTILRLIAVHGEQMLPIDTAWRNHTTTGLGLIGGIAVFWWGAMAVWAAKRVAHPTANTPAIQDLDIRLEANTSPERPTVEHFQLEYPASWSPENRYLVGRPQFQEDWRHLQDHLEATRQQSETIVDTIAHPVGRPRDWWSGILLRFVRRKPHRPD